MCKSFDGSVTVLREGRELPVRLLAEGEEPIPLEDGKTVRGRVDAAKAEQRARPAYKPPPDHPWRRPFKPARAWRPDEAASAGRRAVDLWTSPADRRAPFGACGQPVDNALGRVAIDRAFPPRVAHRLPTLARLSPTTPQLGNKFFLLEKEEVPNRKKGTFLLWRKGDISALR